MNNKLSDEDIKLFRWLVDDEKCKYPHIASQSEVMLKERVLLELLAYREAESKPVAFTDAEELTFPHGHADMWKKPHGFGRDIPLYASPVLSQPVPDEIAIAQAIWSVRAVEEDRMDMELEDLDDTHSVFYEARAVRAVLLSASPALTAAAPELLEALQNMIGAFDNPIVRRKLPSYFNNEAISSARAAIAKATGESE